MTYPAVVIDIHTHTFNSRYLPLQGLMKPYTGRWLAEKIAFIVTRSTGFSFPAASEAVAATASGHDDEESLNTFVRAVEGALTAGGEDPTEELAPTPGLATALRDNELFRELVEVYEVFRWSGESEDEPSNRILDTSLESEGFLESVSATAVQTLAQDVEGLHSSHPTAFLTTPLRRALFWLIRKAGRMILEKAKEWIWHPLQEFSEFIAHLVHSEKENVDSLLSSYQPQQNVKVLVHHLIDMEPGFGPDGETFYPFLPQQLENMKKLADAYPSQLLGFASFDPRGKWREKCEKALALGFCGFKIYPGMGFLPWNDPNAEIRKSILEFFRFTLEHGIPIFAHCTPRGVQAKKGLGLNADPAHWQEVLAQDEFSQLRLCLAHGGGGRFKDGEEVISHGWYAENGEQWKEGDHNYARKVVELCRKHENVYCELGELGEIVEEDTKEAQSFRTNFLREWHDGSEDCAFSRKCMYGSDSFMPGIVRIASNFLDVFANLLPQPADFERFCFHNAVQYLNLTNHVRRLESLGMEEQAEGIHNLLSNA